MKVRLTQLDGSLPNLALMRISAFHKGQGDEVYFHRNAEPDLTEPEYDRVYGSSIFKFSDKKLARFQAVFPDAILGGTGTFSTLQVEDICPDLEVYDYSIYPTFTGSLGFTQRGCRLKCKFCVVPTKEGANRSVNSVYDIWRGEPWPRHLHLLDNDFFGQESWRDRAKEIIEGGFKVCFNQGLNVRLITEEGSAELAKMQYRDDQFKVRRIYTAFDNMKDHKIFFKGIDTLERAGINTKDILAYMLIGFAKGETMEEIQWRFDEMKARGIHPFPMVYDRSRRDLRDFARWAIRGIHYSCTFAEYRTSIRKRDPREGDFFREEAEDAEYPVTLPPNASPA